MRIIATSDASGPLDGKKTIYTVELEREKYFADVMYCADSGLLYVMQYEDGKKVCDNTSTAVDY